ncbi:MAG: hypothetical protein ACI4QX_06430, partial [Lachnospiraceae bacterium]
IICTENVEKITFSSSLLRCKNLFFRDAGEAAKQPEGKEEAQNETRSEAGGATPQEKRETKQNGD